MLPPLPDAWTTSIGLRNPDDFANAMAFSKSNFKRTTSNSKKKKDDQKQITKKLFHSPSSTPQSGIRLGSSADTRGKIMVNRSGYGAKRFRSLLPKVRLI